MVLPAIIPVVPRRRSSSQSSLFSSLGSIPKIAAIKQKSKGNASITNNKNLTTPSDDDQWAEIRDILRPGLPFHRDDNSTNNSTMLYTPNSHHSLMVLLVCLAVLLFSFVILGCKYWYENRRRWGYSPAPNNSPDEHNTVDDVISEIVNRREQVPSKPHSTTQQPYPSTQPPSKNASAILSSLIHEKSSTATFKDIQSPPNDQFIQISNATQSHPCPLSDPKPTKLIPVENLVIPRTFSDAIHQAYPDMASGHPSIDIDKVLSLTKVEKSQSQSGFILKPTPSVSQVQISVEPDINDGKLFTVPGFSLPLSSSHKDVLTNEQREEEQLKFLRACWKNEMRRRRSLCSISSNEDLIDPELYNSIIKRGKTHSARKVKSMPSMILQPFSKISSFAPAYSTDKLGDSPIWSPPATQIPYSSQTAIFSSPPSAYSFQDDWHNAMKAASYSRKVFSARNGETVNTSKTSIWSTVASENADEVVQESEEYDVPPTEYIADKDDDPGDTLSPQVLTSLPKLDRKRSLTALEFIVESVKSVGYIPQKSDSAKSITLESDQLPSELFVQAKKLRSSSDSLLGDEASITNLFLQEPPSFWKNINPRVPNSP